MVLGFCWLVQRKFCFNRLRCSWTLGLCSIGHAGCSGFLDFICAGWVIETTGVFCAARVIVKNHRCSHLKRFRSPGLDLPFNSKKKSSVYLHLVGWLMLQRVSFKSNNLWWLCFNWSIPRKGTPLLREEILRTLHFVSTDNNSILY